MESFVAFILSFFTNPEEPAIKEETMILKVVETETIESKTIEPIEEDAPIKKRPRKRRTPTAIQPTETEDPNRKLSENHKKTLKEYDIFYEKDGVTYKNDTIFENEGTVLFSKDGATLIKKKIFNNNNEVVDKNISCGNESLEVKGNVNSLAYANLNYICLKHNNKEYISNSSKLFWNNDFVIYTQCSDSEYSYMDDQNVCNKTILYINDKILDEIDSENLQMSALGFDGKTLIYKFGNYDYFKINTETKEKEALKDAHLPDFQNPKINNNEIAYLLEVPEYWDGGSLLGGDSCKNNLYDLHFKDTKYEKVAGFHLSENDIYYYQVFPQETDPFTCKVSFMKNDKQIDDFVIATIGSSNLDNLINPKQCANFYAQNGICILPSGDYILKGVSEDSRNIEKIKFSDQQVIELEADKKFIYSPPNKKFILFSKAYEDIYALNMENKKIDLLYKGVPLFIKKK